MCRHAFSRHRHARDAENFFVVVVAMIRRAIAILSTARRDLEEIARGTTHGATSTDIKPTETHLNVPL